MKPLTFTLLAEPGERLDLSALVPDRLAGQPVSDIAALPVGTTRTGVKVGDLFRITGKDASSLVFDGGSRRFDQVGAGMTSGSIRVVGDVGFRAGRAMGGGTLVIEGSAGEELGSGLSGGRIEVTGNAGDRLGAPLAGELQGVSGGTIVVRGKAGHRAGERMRRGLIAVLKGCGDHLGIGMIAGTIVVTGRVGAMPGYLMKRGSLLLDRRPDVLSPTFVDCGNADIAFSGLFDRFLIAEKILDKPLLGTAPTRICGDNAVFGKGEIMFRRRR